MRLFHKNAKRCMIIPQCLLPAEIKCILGASDSLISQKAFAHLLNPHKPRAEIFLFNLKSDPVKTEHNMFCRRYVSVYPSETSSLNEPIIYALKDICAETPFLLAISQDFRLCYLCC